ncbi:MAG: nickel-responsive transcriptional regulator NikR [Polyangiaceae bacterium]
MKDELVRFGVAMEASLVRQLDEVAEARGVTRSEILRDLSRAEVARSRVASGMPAAGALTLVYDHHVRELSEKLTEAQHKMGEQVRSTMHVHLDATNCLEVIVLRGRSDQLQRAAEKLLATRGVKQGGLTLIADTPGTHTHSFTHAHGEDDHPDHAHEHPHDHDHVHDQDHGGHAHDHARDHAPAPIKKGSIKKKTR